MSVRTCLIGQSNLFRAGLKMLLQPTSFDVAKELEDLNELKGWTGTRGYSSSRNPTTSATSNRHRRAQKTSAEMLHRAPCSNDGADQLALSFAAGADGYLLEEISPEALLESLNLVMLGEKVFPSRLAALDVRRQLVPQG